LAKKIRKTAQEGSIIPNDEIKKWIGQLIEAIYYLHNNKKQRIIHRNLNPE